MFNWKSIFKIGNNYFPYIYLKFHCDLDNVKIIKTSPSFHHEPLMPQGKSIRIRYLIHKMSLDMRKPVFGVSKQQKCRPACTGQPAHLLLAFFWKVSYLNLVQAKFHFLASHCSSSLTLSETLETGFITSRPKYRNPIHKRGV